jgi:hypothetical protein
MAWTRAEPGHGPVAMPALLSRILLCAALAEALQPTDLAAQLDGAIPSMRLASGKLSFDGHATVGDFTGTTTTVTGEMTGGESLAAVRRAGSGKTATPPGCEAVFLSTSATTRSAG